jgi:pectinesterase
VGRGSKDDFATIGEAIASIERDRSRESSKGDEWATILISPGVYREKVFLDIPRIELRGLGADARETMIVWGDYAKLALPDGRPMRTFNTATFFAGADHLRVDNLSIENDAGPGNIVGQAVAAYVDADDAIFTRCRLIGRQDTLFTGPLPPSPIEGNDFGGPRDSGPGRLSAKAPDSPPVGRQRYGGCLIVGDIDFIFGSAEAVFRDCEIRSRNLGREVNGWISAASTPRESAPLDGWLQSDEEELLRSLSRAAGRRLPPIGHFFIDCRLTCEPGTVDGSVYLGRPWRDYARTLYARCEMGKHIRAEGWDDWGKSAAREKALYAELDCCGPGAASGGLRRVAWAIAVGSAGCPRELLTDSGAGRAS